ncbi:MAG: SPFH domain-containing protein [Oscillospiraceae bacterium]|nr:SPFH domain-containing protein [Oscillospiraceae bacterium]
MNKKVQKGMKFTLVVFIIALLLVLMVPSLRIVQQEHVAVVRRLGVAHEVLYPGAHLRFWFLDSLERFDVTIQDSEMYFSAHSTDAQNVFGQVSIQYRINVENTMDIIRQFATMRQLQDRLYPALLQETQNVFAMKNAMDLVQQRANLGPEIWNRLMPIASQFHVTITNVALENMSFSEEFERAIDRVAVADQELRRSELDAARDLVYANRDLEVTRISGQELVVQAEAEAAAMIVQAEAEAQALIILQNVWDDLTPSVREVMLRQQAIDTWNGVLPRVVGEGFDLILGDILGDVISEPD